MYSPQHINESLPAPAAIAPHLLTDHPEWTLGPMVGRSPVMQRLFSQMRCTARHLRVATIEGESGTGKALAARTLHDLGPAAAASFIPCPAIQFFQNGSSLVSPSPLVGDSRDGTLFLSHVEELSLEQQNRLVAFLHWLDQQQARRIPDAIPRAGLLQLHSAASQACRSFELSGRPLPSPHRHSLHDAAPARTPRRPRASCRMLRPAIFFDTR